jgi:hypothetical protein
LQFQEVLEYGGKARILWREARIEDGFVFQHHAPSTNISQKNKNGEEQAATATTPSTRTPTAISFTVL